MLTIWAMYQLSKSLKEEVGAVACLEKGCCQITTMLRPGCRLAVNNKHQE